MTRRQYVLNTNKLNKELNVTNPEYSKIVDKLSELYKAATKELWWPEYLIDVEAQHLRDARRNGCIR